MAKNKQKHLTASSKLKPSRRLADRQSARSSVKGQPTYISSELINVAQGRILELILLAENAGRPKRPSLCASSVVTMHSDEVETPGCAGSDRADQLDLFDQRKREADQMASLCLDFSASTPSCGKPYPLNPLRKAGPLRRFIWNVGLDIAMFFAVKHRCQTLGFELKKSLYACSYAVCTKIYRLVRRIERMLGAIHEGSLRVPMQFVLIKVRRLFFHLSQLFFEVTFAIGHRRMLLLEREALALDIHQTFVHVANDLDD